MDENPQENRGGQRIVMISKIKCIRSNGMRFLEGWAVIRRAI